jgi:hypothetical protein
MTASTDDIDATGDSTEDGMTPTSTLCRLCHYFLSKLAHVSSTGLVGISGIVVRTLRTDPERGSSFSLSAMAAPSSRRAARRCRRDNLRSI